MPITPDEFQEMPTDSCRPRHNPITTDECQIACYKLLSNKAKRCKILFFMFFVPLVYINLHQGMLFT